VNIYTDDKASKELAKELADAIDREIVSGMNTIVNNFGDRLRTFPEESISPLFHILCDRGNYRGDYKDIERACDLVITVLGYSIEELPLHVNDGGIVEAAVVWRLRHGI